MEKKHHKKEKKHKDKKHHQEHDAMKGQEKGLDKKMPMMHKSGSRSR